LAKSEGVAKPLCEKKKLECNESLGPPPTHKASEGMLVFICGLVFSYF